MKVKALELSSYAGLTIATFELLFTFRTEYQYIWSNEQGSLFIKIMYLLSRYLALAVHITNAVLVSLVHEYAIIPTHLCRIAVIYQASVLFVMFGILDIILMLRVYALYNRSTYLAVIFLCLLICRFFLPSIISYKGMPTQRFGPSCLVKSAGAHSSVYYFAGGEVLVQFLIVVLTLGRHIIATRDGWGSPLFSLLSRDGAMVFLGITVGMAAVVAVSLDPVDFSHLVFPGLVIIMSSAGCRLIINMQKLGSATPDADPTFTTVQSEIWAVENRTRAQTPAACIL
ncbi:hypothetical protein R3P38DRAFT_1712029 [Favolaschia claudopus]|uniref:DUF6533 domain-containing protein n=1 Tax=Favolaschia claudopus TaxID=2862362 RepID=A0AAW0A952_9AGAR